MLKSGLAALGVALALAGPAAARPGADVTTDYYADAAKTKWVGMTELTCGGGIIRQGRRTAFYTRSSDSCGRARFDTVRMQSFATMKPNPLVQCRAACDRKFNHPPQICLPNSCPAQEQHTECLNACEETYGPNAGSRR
jgi:hypothetical protein